MDNAQVDEVLLTANTIMYTKRVTSRIRWIHRYVSAKVSEYNQAINKGLLEL